MSSKIFCFGELLLRLTPPNHLRLPQTSLLEVQFTGSEANVAVGGQLFSKELLATRNFGVLTNQIKNGFKVAEKYQRQ